MKKCNVCGHKENAPANNWCVLKKSQPKENTCIMWVKGKESHGFDFPEPFADIMREFFTKK